MKANLIHGDCLDELRKFSAGTVDLAYADPPFVTQKVQRLRTRDGSHEFSFSDLWSSHKEYAEYVRCRLLEIHRVLADHGTLYFHCDRKAAHVVRAVLDDVFGEKMFRSEIIWQYRRWSNSRKSLLPAHQTIYFYSKSNNYTFNTIFEEYSPSTNVDQILQLRVRNSIGKAEYARDESGAVIAAPPKKGVPLGDVWDIPYLNPKAKERTGYPTQKPILLLERIIELSSNEGDVVLDPFCGSGTTLVAALLLNRQSIGIDISEDAIELSRSRLDSPCKTTSRLLDVGRESYREAEGAALSLLQGLDFSPVHRNKGIDAILQVHYDSGPVPVRIQRPDETIGEAANRLHTASRNKNAKLMIVVAMRGGGDLIENIPDRVAVVNAPARQIKDLLNAAKC